MTEVPAEAAVTCARCGQDRAREDVARFGSRPEIAICGGCAHSLAGRLTARPAITPIFPVHNMTAAREFWTRAGLEVEEYSSEYAFVLFNGAEVAHLDLHADLDPERNAAACYVHIADPVDWLRRWKEQGLPVSDVVVEPWGMIEFSVQDPSGNLIRLGRND